MSFSYRLLTISDFKNVNILFPPETAVSPEVSGKLAEAVDMKANSSTPFPQFYTFISSIGMAA